MKHTSMDFDIVLVGANRDEFNSIVSDFTKYLKAEPHFVHVMVECVGIASIGSEVKYKIQFDFGDRDVAKRFVKVYELKQRTFERLVALSCTSNGVVNTDKCENLINVLAVGLFTKKLHQKSIEKAKAQEKVDVISHEIQMIEEQRDNLIASLTKGDNLDE